jgi:ATP-dependent Clp protease ATP-binding subunit ClpA
MRLLSHTRGGRIRTTTIRTAERYVVAGADEARRLGCGFVGTEHVLLAIVRGRTGRGASAVARLGLDPAEVESTLGRRLTPGPTRAKIDPEALATLGIDLATVRSRLEELFGVGALERTQSSCLGISPRLKLALAGALDHARDRPLDDEHVLLGMLDVLDSAGARTLTDLGVSADAARAALFEPRP